MKTATRLAASTMRTFFDEFALSQLALLNAANAAIAPIGKPQTSNP